jgi:hypothetical protein
MSSEAARVVGGFRLLLGGFGLISTVSGLISKSTVVALNTVGVVGMGALIIGGIVYFGDTEDPVSNLKFTLITMAIVTAIMGVAFLAGRPLDEGEKQFGVLTIIGIAVALFFAYMASVGADMLMKSKLAQQTTRPDNETTASATTPEVLVPCPHCGAKNRLSSLPGRNVTLQCGKCHREFHYGAA